MKLKEKNALVTGAARRGGRAIALALARYGVSVAVHYHTSRRGAEDVVKQLLKGGVRAKAYRADLSRISEIKKLVLQVRKDFGSIDILVNNAANFRRTPLGRVQERDWDQTLNTNLRGPFFLAKEISLLMKRRGYGVIVNIADWAGFYPYKSYLPYSLSKAGLIAMTKGLARALGPKVKVYALAPRRLRGFKELSRAVVRLLEEKGFTSGATYGIDGRLLAR